MPVLYKSGSELFSMKDGEFKALLVKGLHKLGISLPQQRLDPLERYFNDLKKWNSRVNLIAKRSADEQIVENHFIDSLTLFPYLREKQSHLVDIGTGGGFPGLVCKVAQPDLKVSLIEPRLKRVSFLKHIVRSLRLTEVDIYGDRVENVTGLIEDKCISHVTSRAVTEIGPFLQMVERFHKTGATVVMMKGPKWREELQSSADIIEDSRFDLQEVAECTLPFSQARRSLLFFNVQ